MYVYRYTCVCKYIHVHTYIYIRIILYYIHAGPDDRFGAACVINARVNFESENPIVPATAAAGVAEVPPSVPPPIVSAGPFPYPPPWANLVPPPRRTHPPQVACLLPIEPRGKPECAARAELERHATAGAGAPLRDPETFCPGTVEATAAVTTIP